MCTQQHNALVGRPRATNLKPPLPLPNIQTLTDLPPTPPNTMCGNLFQVWRGTAKFTSDHALFIARVHPRERKLALLDYWLARIAVFVTWCIIYVLFNRYAMVHEPHADPFVALHYDLTPTRYFYGFMAAFGILVWNFIFKGDMVNDARFLRLPNALPPRLPIIAHAQVFWRDYFRSATKRACHRLETLTNAAQTVANDAGLTRYWLRPWGPPVVYVSHPDTIRDMFMLEEFIEVYINGRACRYLPKTLLSCGYGHPLQLIKPVLLTPTVVSAQAQHYTTLAQTIVDQLRSHPTKRNMDLLAMVNVGALDSICGNALGPDFRPDAVFRNHFNVAVDGAAAVLAAPPPSFPLPSWLWTRVTSEGRSIVRAANGIEQYVVAEVQRRRRRLEASASALPTCLADHLLRRYPGGTDHELTEDLVAFMVQRYAVLVTGIVWTLRELLCLKSAQQKKTMGLIRQQGKEALLAAANNKATKANEDSTDPKGPLAQLQLKMPTLERCVREALRLHPPAPALAPLTLLKNVQLGGYSVKAKSEIRLMPFMVQRSAKYWKNNTELTFDEGRWKHHVRQSQLPFASCAFGAGLLQCASPELTRKGIQWCCWNVLNEFALSVVPVALEEEGEESGPPCRTSLLLPAQGLFVNEVGYF